MRVLYLNPFSQEVSGPDESLLALLGGLVPLGVEPHVVLPRPGPQVSRYQALGARVHLAPLTFLKRTMSLTDVLLFLPHLARSVLAVARVARRNQIDLIHTNMEVVLDGSIASRFLRLPHVLHYRGNTLDRPKLVFDVLSRFWTATSDRVFCISDATAEIFRRRGRGARVETLYNPVDVGAFSRAKRCESVRSELGGRPGALLVGTVGRLHPRKDVATFLRMAALLPLDPPARFVVVGSAESPEEIAYERDLRALALSLGIADRVCWAGSRRDMPAVLKAIDLFVLCSRHEGFGRVAAEAMAAGVPVALTEEGAFPELARGVPGVALAPPASPEAFARAAVEALRAHNETQATADLAVARFAVATRATRVHEIYQRLLSARRSARE